MSDATNQQIHPFRIKLDLRDVLILFAWIALVLALARVLLLFTTILIAMVGLVCCGAFRAAVATSSARSRRERTYFGILAAGLGGVMLLTSLYAINTGEVGAKRTAINGRRIVQMIEAKRIADPRYRGVIATKPDLDSWDFFQSKMPITIRGVVPSHRELRELHRQVGELSPHPHVMWEVTVAGEGGSGALMAP